MAAVHVHPDRDWGTDITASSSLQHILKHPEYKDKALYFPPTWFSHSSALFLQPWTPTPMEHLPSISERVETSHGHGVWREVYPTADELEVFWDTVTKAKQVLNEAKGQGHTEDTGEFSGEVSAVKNLVETRTRDITKLERNVERLKAKLGISTVVLGYDAFIN